MGKFSAGKIRRRVILYLHCDYGVFGSSMILKTTAGVCFLLFGFFLSPVQADLMKGLAAYQKKDYATAIAHFKEASEGGDRMAIHMMGSLYFEGHGVEKDLAKAAEYFSQAADKGFRAAQWSAGLMYHQGNGVKKDIQKAIGFYEKGAKAGDSRCSFSLGQIYRTGEGVKRNREKTFYYFHEAATAGYIPAFNEYGLLYAEGFGVDMNMVEAYAWIALGVGQGETKFEKNLINLRAVAGEEVKKKGEERLAELRDHFKLSDKKAEN